MRYFIRHYLYPLLLLWVVIWTTWGFFNPQQLQFALLMKSATMVPLLMWLEWRYPLSPNWGMTWQFLTRRDLVFIAVNGLTFAAINYGLVFIAIDISASNSGPLTGQPIILQLVIALLVFETLQYSVHRLMHSDNTPFSRFLWRSHAIHHLPQQLYVIMHAVFHPVNAVIVRLGVQVLPLWLLGYEPMVVFIMGSIIGLHGLISHLNLDLRLGRMNYVFVGPELHRFHHSAKAAEAVNFAAALSFFDLLFGTFRYTPDEQPKSLGLRVEDGYPQQVDPIRALVFPFKPTPTRLGESPRNPA